MNSNRTVVYPDYDDNGEKVLYYAEFIPFKDKVLCKVYKRMFFDYPSFGNIREGHPYVVFEYQLTQTEPSEATTKFMVDALNEKYNREK